MGLALDWESHKSLKHHRECLTELIERAFFQPYAIQQIQLSRPHRPAVPYDFLCLLLFFGLR